MRPGIYRETVKVTKSGFSREIPFRITATEQRKAIIRGSDEVINSATEAKAVRTISTVILSRIDNGGNIILALFQAVLAIAKSKLKAGH